MYTNTFKNELTTDQDPELQNRTEHNFIENYASQATHRWR